MRNACCTADAMKIAKIYFDEKKPGRLMVVVEGSGFYKEVPLSWDLNQLKTWFKRASDLR
jgi:hypothetical protein